MNHGGNQFPVFPDDVHGEIVARRPVIPPVGRASGNAGSGSMPPLLRLQTQSVWEGHGTLGRAVAGCVVMVVVAGCKPSAVAVSLISPASRVDCTMICARPLKTLRDHALAAGLPMSSTF